MKPLIGLPAQYVSDSPWKPTILGQRESYIQAVVAAGGLPFIIPPIHDEDVLRELYSRLDAVLLCGGGDVTPELYGRQAIPEMAGMDLRRDAAELRLARWAIADGKPLLGICRGAQIINVACGGTLFRDLAIEHPGSINHNASADAQDMATLIHAITLDRNSYLATLLGKTRLRVNSLHHQAVERLGKGLRAVARADDQLIEAFEGPGFTLGIQCHPEILWHNQAAGWARLFDAFTLAAVTARTASASRA